MTALTKTAIKRINGHVRQLQRYRNDTLAGRYLPWGVPWCKGPASPYHQPPVCEGCGVRASAGDEAARIAEQIRQLQARLTPTVQELLW